MTVLPPEGSESSSVYVLLSKDHRVSRSFRATWHLRSLLTGQSWAESSSDDLSVLSVVGGPGGVSAMTDVFYICQQYSLVFVLDMTPTMVQVSNQTCQVKLNEAVAALTASLNLLTKPFCVPGSQELLEPDLVVTVLAYCGNHPGCVKVLLQGFCLKSSNCDEIARKVAADVTALENRLSRGKHEEQDSSGHEACNGEASLEGLIKFGTLALQLLPRNALKGIVVLTDGVLGFSSPSSMHTAVNQMRGANTSCWVIQVGGRSEPSAAFGLMPDSETLKFLSLACNGCVIQPTKVLGVSKKAGSLNFLQEAVLIWSYQQTAHARRVAGVVDDSWGAGQVEEEEEHFSPTIYRQFDKNTIHAPLLCVIGCRVRDGFFLKSATVREQDSTVVVAMYYPWQASVNIYYTIQSPWPLSEASTALHTTISYDGPYSFVHDVHCNLNEPITSYYRAAAVRKFKQVLKSQSYSDTFLAHFLSFSATPNYHTLPQKIQDGMPLFHLPPNQSKPVPAVSLSSSGDKKKKESALVNFWSPLCTIDTNLWYRWFHTDKIILILHQDTYLPRNLLSPSANHRFSTVQCRIAASKLFNYLKTWSSFVLLENQSFIRFLPTTESPLYFSLVRVAQKHPCIVLHVGHIEGTPHSLQAETVRELQEALPGLNVERVQPSKRSRGSGNVRGGKAAKPCAFLVKKQLQRVMIRYDGGAGAPYQSTAMSLTQTGMETERLVQNDYLSGTAWQWIVPHSLPTLLTALLRHRLKEGFHIARAQSGIVTLTAQLYVAQPNSHHSLPMLLQYIIFPLATNNSASFSSSSAVAGISGGHPTCELWVEPQYGTVTEAPAGLQYILGSAHSEIADKIHAKDKELMLTMSSFIYLHHMCGRGCHALPRAPLEEEGDAREGAWSSLSSSVPRSVLVPFQVSRLLPKCRVIGFALDAFPEATVKQRLSSPLQSSTLNTFFWKQLFEKLRELAPTEVPLSSTPLSSSADPSSSLPPSSPSSPSSSSSLIQRLLSSEHLREFCQLCDIGGEDKSDMGWRCLAKIPSEEENAVCLFLVTDVFFRGSSTNGTNFNVGNKIEEEGEEEKDGGEGERKEEEEKDDLPSEPFFLPLLLLHCDQDILMDPDPATPTPPTLLPDIFQHLTLALSHSPSPSFTQALSTLATPITTPTPSPLASIDANTLKNSPDPLAKLYSSLANESLGKLVSKLRALHFSSYLHAIHTTLTHKHPVPPAGFYSAVDICAQTTVSLDCTPLVGALCRHSRLSYLSPLPLSAGRHTGKEVSNSGHKSEADESTASVSTDGQEDLNTSSTGQRIEASSDGAATLGVSEEHLQFAPESLTRLIQQASSCSTDPVRSSSYRLELVEQFNEEGDTLEQVPHCVQWEGEPHRVFLDHLSEAGFESVPDCPGYFWLRGDDAESPRKAKKLRRGGEEDGEAVLSSPSEASTIKRKQSLTTENTTWQSGESDQESGSTGDDADIAALSPLFSPSDPHFMESSRGEPTLPTAPLFLHATCNLRRHPRERDGEGGEGDEERDLPLHTHLIPTCLISILFPDTIVCAQPDRLSATYSVSLTLSFLSFCPKTVTQPATRPTTDDDISGEFSAGVLWSESPSLPVEYHSHITTIKQKVECLMADELISVSRECPPVTLSLLQAVDTHVHTSHVVSSCLHQGLPLKFVFGAHKSMLHLMTELEAIEIPGYTLEKMGDEYYHLSPAPFPLPSLPNTPDILDHAPESTGTAIFSSLSVPWLPPHRSKTPDSSALGGNGGRGQGHRRSTSVGVFSSSSSVSVTPVPLGTVRTRRRGSVQGLLAAVGDAFPSNNSLAQAGSSYDASRSSSCSELSMRPPPPPRPLDTPPFWLVLRVVPEEIQLFFQIRHSVPDLEGCLAKLHPLITTLRERARESCHRANQLLLLRDMLETRQCSHLLLPESLSEAWVENVVHKRMPSLMEGGGCGPEGFSPQQFRCDLQWSKHITPHYRLKSMKMNIRMALQITRVALDAFAVTNRKDVYVFQDVQENAAESIFYLKIDESLCRVYDTVETEDSPIGYDRCDTRATEAETMSTASYHPSISVSEQVGQDPDRQSLAESLVDQPGKPRESLVLQLYGINRPSQSLLERLTHRIIFKLDDAALEIMCGLYARNHKLKLTPSDVQFLQTPGATPSRQLRILVPLWVREIHALFFYFLQSLSTLALKPKYASQETHIRFQVPQSVQNMCLSAGLPAELHQDLLFLYIRPHTQGRGMAVFSVSLADSSGRLVPPQPSEVSPHEGGWNPANLDLTLSVCAQGTEAVLEDDQESPHRGGGYQLKVDIWEKGNVGITDLSAKLHLCLKQALCDYILELYFLPQPIARIDEMLQLEDSPSATSPFVVLEPSPPEPSRRESLDSPRRTLFEKGEVRVPSSLGFLSQRSHESGGVLSPDTPVQGEPHRSHCDTVSVTTAMDDVFHSLDASGKDDAAFDPPPEVASSTAGFEAASSAAGLTWQEKELNRRETEAMDAYQREAHHGRQGVLENTYSSLVPQHFAETCRLSSRSVAHYSFPLLGSYSSEVFLNETLSFCTILCPDLTLSTFRLGSNGVYAHYIPQKTSRIRSSVEVEETKFVAVGRNLKQWDEARSPDVVEIRLTQPWIDAQAKQSLQMFHPLDSKKISKTVDCPLTSLAKDRPSFIPRQRLLLLSLSHKMAELWLYNLSEELVTQVRNRLDGLNKWQQTRVGFLHHLLAQKMGLFQHTRAQDLREWTTLAAKHCSSLQDTVILYRNPSPVSTASSQRQQRPQPIPALESLYQEAVPTGHTPHTMDPVYNHGHQVRESHAHFRRTYESRDLLGKVFTSWPNQSGAGAVPVEASLIRQLKRLARLLHFCSSRLLLRPPPAPPGHTPMPTQTAWFDGIRNETLSRYIQYLKTLNFEEITERASPQLQQRRSGGGSHTPTRLPQPAPPVSVLPQKFYKCMQRSWTHGIILVELTFVEERFDVKLLTLESSRLNGQKSLTPEAHSLFSCECARYKDLIHLHSFMHDFHLSVVLGMVSGERKIPEWLDLKAFLEQFTRENKHPPTFNRHRLERGQIKVPLPNVKPAQLYHHILAHSDVFNMHTLELGPAGTSTASSSTSSICLHIDVSPQSLGPTTSPQLSKLLQDAHESYSIHVVAMCEDANPHCLVLAFYLLLVNFRDKFPRLTRDRHSSSIVLAPLYSQYNILPSPDELAQQSSETELHLSVRKRRMKLGLDPHQRSVSSQLVVDGALIAEHMRSLQGHFEGVVKNALHHMRRDELWKRMLYGGHKTDPSKPAMMQASFEQLRCDEFRDLLRLVTICPLEKLDPQLSALRRQTKKWFRRLMSAMKIRFSESVRVYKTENENYFFTVVINPDWADMVVLAQSDRDGKSQGLYAVYRKPKEGSLVPQDQRPLTAHVEADRQHIENVVNFCCCYLWASMLDSTPPQPQLNLL